MLGSGQGVAFLPSCDLERSRRFFEGLGLVVDDVTPFACVLRAGSTTLRVTRVDELRPQPFTVFGWQVDDIAAVVTGLDAAGVAVLRYDGLGQDATGVWTTPDGSRVAWFHDPDGNVLSVTQLAG